MCSWKTPQCIWHIGGKLSEHLSHYEYGKAKTSGERPRSINLQPWPQCPIKQTVVSAIFEFTGERLSLIPISN